MSMCRSEMAEAWAEWALSGGTKGSPAAYELALRKVISDGLQSGKLKEYDEFMYKVDDTVVLAPCSHGIRLTEATPIDEPRKYPESVIKVFDCGAGFAVGMIDSENHLLVPTIYPEPVAEYIQDIIWELNK